MEEKTDGFDLNIEDYNRRIGLPQIKTIEDQVSKYINWDFRDKLSSEGYSEGAAVLSQFALHIKKELNKEVARKASLTSRINKIMAHHLPQIKSYNWEERKIMAVNLDDVATKLDAERTKADIRIANLDFLANSIKDLSDKFVELSRAYRKRYQE